MTNDGLSDKTERAIVGAYDFGRRLAYTFLAIAFRPKRLVRSLDSKERREFLSPHTFLLSCVIGIGIFGKILSGGIENFDPTALERFKDLTLWSFVAEIVTTFAVAIVASTLAQLVVGHGTMGRDGIRAVSYYLVGFFALWTFVAMLLLFVAVSHPGIPSDVRLQWATPMAILLVVMWLLYLFVLLQRMCLHVVRKDDGPSPSRADYARTSFASALVLTLCVLGFVLPNWSAQRAAPAQGSLVDVELQPNGSHIRLAYIVRNEADSRMAINLGPPARIFVSRPSATPIDFDASFHDGCDLQPPKETFVMIEPGKSMILTSCAKDPRLLEMLEAAAFAPNVKREGGKSQLTAGTRKPLELSVLLEFTLENRKPITKRINVAHQAY